MGRRLEPWLSEDGPRSDNSALYPPVVGPHYRTNLTQGPNDRSTATTKRETVRVDPVDRAPVDRTQVQNSRLLPLYNVGHQLTSTWIISNSGYSIEGSSSHTLTCLGWDVFCRYNISAYKTVLIHNPTHSKLNQSSIDECPLLSIFTSWIINLL